MLILPMNAANDKAGDVSLKFEGGDVGYIADPFIYEGKTYIPVRLFCALVAPDTEIKWDENAKTAAIHTKDNEFTLKVGSKYVKLGDTYYSVGGTIKLENGTLFAPLRALTALIGGDVEWDASSMTANITSAEEDAGDAFALTPAYTDNDLYWLARIIYAESRGEPFQGKLAVGNVILNRVKSPAFPNSIYDVIFDHKNGVQFTPTKNGSIYKEPDAECIRAAKMCLEGENVVGKSLYFFNPRTASSSWIKNHRKYIVKIGNHAFYA